MMDASEDRGFQTISRKNNRTQQKHSADKPQMFTLGKECKICGK